VLVVDDDEALLDSLQVLLESCGFLVRCVANAGEAMLELNAHRPDVVLTDIHMLGGDGFELINAMRRFQALAPIVAMSGGINELPLAKMLGASETIGKPFTGLAVIDAIERAIGARRSAHEVVTATRQPDS
jgi:FixJ family two-component response regulator